MLLDPSARRVISLADSVFPLSLCSKPLTGVPFTPSASTLLRQSARRLLEPLLRSLRSKPLPGIVHPLSLYAPEAIGSPRSRPRRFAFLYSQTISPTKLLGKLLVTSTLT